jgi:outer membrane protein
MHRNAGYCLVVGLLLSWSGWALAASEVKLGVVDVQKIVQHSPEVEQLNKRLEAQFKSRQQTLISEDETFQKKMQKFNRESSVMGESQREKMSEELNREGRDMQRAQQDFQEDLEAAKQKAKQDLMQKIQKSIAALAKQEKYDVVLSKFGMPYVNESVDLTDKVIEQLKKSS